MPTRRILHTTTTPEAAPAIGVNKPGVYNVLARLTRLVGIIFRLQGYDKLYGLQGFLLQKALLLVNPYVCIFLVVMISSLANHSM